MAGKEPRRPEKSRGGRERAVVAGGVQHGAERDRKRLRVRRRIEGLRGDFFNFPPQTCAEKCAYGVVLNRWARTHRIQVRAGR